MKFTQEQIRVINNVYGGESQLNKHFRIKEHHFGNGVLKFTPERVVVWNPINVPSKWSTIPKDSQHFYTFDTIEEARNCITEYINRQSFTLYHPYIP